MPQPRPSTTTPSQRRHPPSTTTNTPPNTDVTQEYNTLTEIRQDVNKQRAGTAAPRLTRSQQKKIEAQSRRIIPGEFFYKSFDKQLGEKCGLVTWTHRKEMRKIHVDQIRYSKSYVTMDVDAHKDKVEQTRKIWFQPERDARVKFLADRKITLKNDDLVRRIKKRLSEDTPITLAASPQWRKRHDDFKVVQKNLQRIAEEQVLKRRARDNMELLHLIEHATPHYDPNEWEEAYQRHLRLKKAMRKVDDPEKKKKSKKEKAAALLAKPEKLKTKREALLGELYSHAMSPKFVETYCDTVNKDMEKITPQNTMPQLVSTPGDTRRQDNNTSDGRNGSSSSLGWGGNSSLLLSRDGSRNRNRNGGSSSSSSSSSSRFGSRYGNGRADDGESEWDDKEQGKLLIMMPQKMNLGGKDVLVGVYRAKPSELALRIVLEDLETFAQRSVYLTYKAMHRMTKRHPALLDDTHSNVRAGKDGKRDKGNRMKSLLLLLDLSGAFKREVVRLPPSPKRRARTAMGGKRRWKRAPGTAGATSRRRTKGLGMDTSLEIERPRTTTGLRTMGSVVREDK